MNIEKVDAWRSSDGTLHETPTEARGYDASQRFGASVAELAEDIAALAGRHGDYEEGSYSGHLARELGLYLRLPRGRGALGRLFEATMIRADLFADAKDPLPDGGAAREKMPAPLMMVGPADALDAQAAEAPEATDV